MLFSQIFPPTPSLRVPKSILYICVSFAVSRIGSSLPSGESFFEPWGIQLLRSWRKGFCRCFSLKGWSVLGPQLLAEPPAPARTAGGLHSSPEVFAAKILSRAAISTVGNVSVQVTFFTTQFYFAGSFEVSRCPYFGSEPAAMVFLTPRLTWSLTLQSSANRKPLSSQDPTHFKLKTSSVKLAVTATLTHAEWETPVTAQRSVG